MVVDVGVNLGVARRLEPDFNLGHAPETLAQDGAVPLVQMQMQEG